METAEASVLHGCVYGVGFDPAACLFSVCGIWCWAVLYVGYDRDDSWRGGVEDTEVDLAARLWVEGEFEVVGVAVDGESYGLACFVVEGDRYPDSRLVSLLVGRVGCGSG